MTAAASLREPFRLTLTLTEREVIAQRGKAILDAGGRYGPPRFKAVTVTLPWSKPNRTLALELLESFGGLNVTLAGRVGPPHVRRLSDPTEAARALAAVEDACAEWYRTAGAALETKHDREAALETKRARFTAKAEQALRARLGDEVVLRIESKGPNSFWASLDGVDFEVTISDVRIE